MRQEERLLDRFLRIFYFRKRFTYLATYTNPKKSTKYYLLDPLIKLNSQTKGKLDTSGFSTAKQKNTPPLNYVTLNSELLTYKPTRSKYLRKTFLEIIYEWWGR